MSMLFKIRLLLVTSKGQVLHLDLSSPLDCKFLEGKSYYLYISESPMGLRPSPLQDLPNAMAFLNHRDVALPQLSGEADCGHYKLAVARRH